MQLKIRGDDGGGEFGIGGRSGTRAPDLGGNVVKLLAVLVRYYRPAGSPCVCRNLGKKGLELVLRGARLRP